MKSYYNLYKKAGKLIKENKVKIKTIKENKEYDLFLFEANGNQVRLKLSRKNKENKRSVWLREWGCDCKSTSINPDVVCYHILACEVFLCIR